MGISGSMPSSTVMWFLIAGVLLVLMALAGSVLKRLPLSSSMLYLLVGIGIGPYGLNMVRLDLVRDAHLLESLTEVAVIVSLFTAGLKLGPGLSDKRWLVPLRLATVSMALTVGIITLAGVYLLHLPVGAAVLLGAILAPTDPVLASEVTVEHHEDRDRLRFGLTGEAGMNDGTAFPFVMLGLGLLGLHELGPGGIRWFGLDVAWAVAAGLGSGFGMGWIVARLVLHLRKRHQEAVGLDEFLTLGLIALSYGFALLIYSYGFLAVFAAGLALRHVEQHETHKAEEIEKQNGKDGAASPSADIADVAKAETDEKDEKEVATDPKQAPAYLARAVLSFNEQLERIGEVVLVVLVGGTLHLSQLPSSAVWFLPMLFLIVRPVAVLLGLAATRTSRLQRGLFAWFGIRGIGSLYYLTYAIGHGLPESIARELIGLVLAAVATSVFVHGISVTPLMNRYQKGGTTGNMNHDAAPPEAGKTNPKNKKEIGVSLT